MIRKILLAAALAAIATPALADGVWTAAPATPSTANGFVGDKVIWNCSASGCTSQSDTSISDDISECRGVARQIGALTSFTSDRGPLAAARLAECNKAAHK